MSSYGPEHSTVFAVTQETGASDLVNAGGPRYDPADWGPFGKFTNVDCAGGVYLVDKSVGANWIGSNGHVEADDWVIADTGALREWRQVRNAPAGDTIELYTACTAFTGKTVNVGGSWLTIQHALDVVDSTTVRIDPIDSSIYPPKIFVKTSTYNEQLIPPVSGTPTIPINVEGFSTTIGDEAAQPLVTYGGAGFTLDMNGKQYLTFALMQLEYTGSTANKGVLGVSSGTSNYNVFDRCLLHLFNTGSGNFFTINSSIRYSNFRGCEIFAEGSGNNYADCWLNNLDFCDIHGGFHGSYGNINLNYKSVANKCLIRSSRSGPNVFMYRGSALYECVVYGGAAGGVNIADCSCVVERCIISGNGSWGLSVGRGFKARYNCAWGSNAYVINIAGDPAYPDSSNIIADPQFIDPANGDFRLKPTSPCRGMFNGPIPFATGVSGSNNSSDIGAIQRKEQIAAAIMTGGRL